MDPMIPEPVLQAAIRLIGGRPAVTVVAAISPQQPDGLMRAMIAAARRSAARLTLMFADLDGRFAFLDEQCRQDVDNGKLHLVALAGAIPRRWSQWVDYFPNSLWDIDRMLADGTINVDVVLARMSSTGFPAEYDYGSMVGYTPAALATTASAAFEIVEPVMSGMPVTLRVAADRADFICAGAAQASRHAIVSLSPEQRETGRLAASLIPDEATLQLGLGAIAEAIVPHLAQKRDLGIHSGIMLPGLLPFVNAGVINGRAKSRDVGLVVATGIFGQASDPTAGRDAIRLRPISETHDPGILQSHHRLWAVNSAFEVDLKGQVNAEFADGVRIASGGGQTDFVRAAHLCDGGASVIALTSRTRDGRSRIVSRLSADCPPTSAAQDIDFVVTEYGIADLRGRSMQERKTALVAIAHPDDRPALIRDARKVEAKLLEQAG